MNDYRITAGHELSLLKAQLLALGGACEGKNNRFSLAEEGSDWGV